MASAQPICQPDALEIECWQYGLSGLEAAWERVVDPDHPGAVFHCYAWASTWWTYFSRSRKLHVLVARRRGRVVGLLPLYQEPGLGGSTFRLIGDNIVGSDYLGVIALTPDREEVARACASHLSATGAGLLLDGLDDNDELARALGGSGAVSVEPRYSCPSVRIQGEFESYLAARPQGMGGQFRRRRRWLERRPGFGITVLEEPDEIDAGLEVLFRLHRARWAVEGGSQAIDGPEVEAFHHHAARLLAERGWARLFVLSADGAPRAAAYGFETRRRFSFYQTGYDTGFAAHSVGTVLLGSVIEHCFRAGLDEFDFLRGDEPYKLRWATGARRLVRLRRVGEGVAPWLRDSGRRLWRGLLDAGKRRLPRSTVERVRRLRRRVLHPGGY